MGRTRVGPSSIAPRILALIALACATAPSFAQTQTQAQQISGAAYQAADEAYKAFDKGDYDLALKQAREAVRLAPDKRDYRRLLVSVLLRKNLPKEAEDNISRLLADNPDAELSAERGYLRAKRGDRAGAMADFAIAARSNEPGTEKGRALRLALADASLAAKSPQQALAALSPYARERSYEIQSRRGFALAALKRHEAALLAFKMAAFGAKTAGERAAMTRAYIGSLVDLGRKDDAKERFQSALRGGFLRGTGNLDIAYLALRVGDDFAALDYFRRAKARGELKGSAAFDAGYVAKRLSQNAEAVEFFKLGLDSDAKAKARDPQYIFGVRREIADLERVWGATFSFSYGGVGASPVGPGATPPAGGKVAQVGGELYWRPPEIGNRNGALFEFFGRAFETLYDQTGGGTGPKTIQTTVGARWKPFSDINLVFEAGRMMKTGDLARNDWLTRAAISTGEGTDLRADAAQWHTWQVYAEYDYFLETAQTIALFEGRLGESFRLDAVNDRLVLLPHVALIARYDNTLATRESYGVGPGIVLRQWFNEDKYTAPRSYIEGVVQYRFKLGGDDRVKGIFAGVNVAY